MSCVRKGWENRISCQNMNPLTDCDKNRIEGDNFDPSSPSLQHRRLLPGQKEGTKWDYKVPQKSQISSLRHKGNRKEHIFQITTWLAKEKKKIYLKLTWKGRGRWLLSVLHISRRQRRIKFIPLFFYYQLRGRWNGKWGFPHTYNLNNVKVWPYKLQNIYQNYLTPNLVLELLCHQINTINPLGSFNHEQFLLKTLKWRLHFNE